MLRMVLPTAFAAAILAAAGTAAVANGGGYPAPVYKDLEREPPPWPDGPGRWRYRTYGHDYTVPCRLRPYFPRSHPAVEVGLPYAVGEAPVYNRPPCVCD